MAWCPEADEALRWWECKAEELLKEEWALARDVRTDWEASALRGAAGKAHEFATVKDLQDYKLAEGVHGEANLRLADQLHEHMMKWQDVWGEGGHPTPNL